MWDGRIVWERKESEEIIEEEVRERERFIGCVLDIGCFLCFGIVVII